MALQSKILKLPAPIPISDESLDTTLCDLRFSRLCCLTRTGGDCRWLPGDDFSKRLADGKDCHLCRRGCRGPTQPDRLVGGAACAIDRRAAADVWRHQCPQHCNRDPKDAATGGQVWTRIYARRNGFPQVIHSSKRFLGADGVWRSMSGFGVSMALRMLVDGQALAVSQRWLLCAGRTPEVRVAGFPHARCTDGDPFRFRPGGEFRFTLEIIHPPLLAGLVRQSAVFPGGNAMTSNVFSGP